VVLTDSTFFFSFSPLTDTSTQIMDQGEAQGAGRIKEKHKGQDEAAENSGKERKVHKSMSPEWWWTGGRFMQQIGLAAYCFYMRAAMFTVPPIRKCDLWGEIASGIQLIISETW
jgi:hypothetical protein